MAHIPEVILLLGTASVAVTPALGGWLDTIKSDTTVEVISVVCLSLSWARSNKWTIAGLNERVWSALLHDSGAHWVTGWLGVEGVVATHL